ncbi:deoxycytidyl transferase [Elasticomyces elasticus]|nr:deoxycytidyl transferase [Elasticomyces elasticus]
MRSSWYASRLKATGVVNQVNSPSHPVQSGHDEINAFGEPIEEPIDAAEDGLENLEHNVDQEEHDEIQDDPPAVENQIPPVHLNLKSEVTSEEYNAQLLSDPRMRASSVVNPDFLQQFYRESRLHHLSTWKADLKAQLQAAAKEKSESHVGGKKRVLGSRRYIIHVDFDCFFAAVSILKHPELHDKPVAIAHGTGTGSEIASCNYIARSQGVKNGMWMKGALDACPELKVLPYDFPAYEDASRKFYSSVLSIDGIVQSALGARMEEEYLKGLFTASRPGPMRLLRVCGTLLSQKRDVLYLSELVATSY